MKKLKPEILTLISKKTGKSINTIRKNISLLKREFPNCTSNAIAHVYALKHGFSVLQKIDKEDRSTLPNFEIQKSKLILKPSRIKRKEKILKILDYGTKDYFIDGHIKEINLAYSKGCFTCVNILLRKIIENLLTDILRKKYPPNSLKNKELYFDINRGRIHDFSVIIDNMYKKRTDFNPNDKKIIERLVSLVKNIKSDANDKAHSWFYLVKNEKELDDLNIQSIIELIKKLEESVGIRC